jgi:hypothetical protein
MNSPAIDMKIGYNNKKLIPSVICTKFLGLNIDSTSCWMHTDHLTTKLSSACYVIRSIKPFMSPIKLLLIYHSLSYSHELQNNIMGKFLS